MCEQSIVEDAYQRLKENTSIKACCEVPMLGRFADLVYITGKSVVAIEFKLHNWRRAIRQSYDHRLGADFAYICMPERKITQEMRNELSAAGVGLKFYLEDGDWPFEEVIPAPRSQETWKVVRNLVRKYIQRNQETYGVKI